MNNIQELSKFWQMFYENIDSWLTLLVSVATGFFAFFQFKINKRLRELQDYVAISIIPSTNEGVFQLQLRNVGRSNIYLHKYEVGNLNDSYEKPRLISCGPETFFIINVPPNLNVEMPVKFYVTDEFGKKYLSTGAVIIDAQPVAISIPQNVGVAQLQTGVPQQVTIQGKPRAWSYKTEPYDWVI
jgi:hypothetical protein